MHQPDTPDFEILGKSRGAGTGPSDDATQKAAGSQEHDHGAVPTSYDAGTGRRLGIFAGTFALILLVAFFLVHHIKGRDQTLLETTTAERAEQPPPVDVVKVQLAPPTQMLTLPGETRGWYSSTIYARVNGYLAKWFVDIGDRVKKDQVLATIDTPDLDAQLAAAQALLVAQQAEEKV